MSQPGFFDLDQRYTQLSAHGDPLEILATAIPWESFRPVLQRALRKERKSAAGRKPYDPVLMFKVLTLQSLYNLSDEQTEYQLRDRLSFMRFLGLSLHDRVPDEKTIWLFRNTLAPQGVIETVFARFQGFLDQQGYTAQQGTLVDARIVSVPTQRNTRQENQQVKAGTVPEPWDAQPAKRRQKDTDARWTQHHGKSYYGYKNHVAVDVRHKLVRTYTVTPATTHDSQALTTLLPTPNTRQAVWADSAYRSAEISTYLKAQGLQNNIHYKGYRNHPLTTKRHDLNQRRSRIRVRVEHVFGFQVNSMRSTILRGVGFVRARTKIGLQNLVYNMCRYTQLCKLAT
jgi:IS5 family transposase